MGNVNIGPVELILLLVLAIGLAVGVTTGKSVMLAGGVFVAAIMIAAFMSTPFCLYLLVYSMLLGPEVVFGGEFAGAAQGRKKAGTVGHGMTLRMDDFVLVIVGLIWLVKTAIHKVEAPFKDNPLNGPMFLYVAACAVATFIGVLMGRVRPLPGFFFNLKYFEYFFLYFMVVNVVTSWKMAKGLINASLITCFCVTLVALAQVPSGERPSAPFEGEEGEPNTLGGYLVLIMSIVIGLLLTPGAVKKRWPYLTLMALSLLTLLATLSRTSYLSAVIVLVAVLLKTSWKRPLLLLMVLLTISASPWWIPDAVKKRVFFTFSQAAEAGQEKVGGLRIDTSTSDRLRSWKQTVDNVQQAPLFGAGVTGSRFFMDAMLPRILTETGLVGFATFTLLLYAVFKVGWNTFHRSKYPYMQGLALGFLFGFLAMLVHSVGSNTFIIVRIMEPFWLFAGLIVKMQLMEDEGVEPEPEVQAWLSRQDQELQTAT